MKKKSKKLSKATQEWIDNFARPYNFQSEKFEGGFEQTEKGVVAVDKSSGGPTGDPSENCKSIYIRGLLLNFLNREGELVKFAPHEGVFQVQASRLTNLDGIPDEIGSDYDGTSEFTVITCHALREFKETYLPRGADQINISDCRNLEKIHIRGEANAVNLSNLPNLTKLIIDPQISWVDEMHIFIDNCSSLTIEGIDAKKCYLNIFDCEMIGFDAEEEEAEEFLKAFKDKKVKQSAKKLGLI